MRRRVSLMLGAMIWLAACGPAGKSAMQTEPTSNMACALAFATQFTDSCGYDLVKHVLTLNHPDGGFRRLRILQDGQGIIAADGAFPAISTKKSDGRVMVRIEDDRYLLPATF